MMGLEVTIWFIVLGFLGGIIHVVMDAESWSDLKKFGAFKASVLGAASGFIYSILYSDYNFPNSIMTIISGYCGTDFIINLIEKYKHKP